MSARRSSRRAPTPAERMVETQIRARGVRDERVLRTLTAVPRDRFVPEDQRWASWDDSPLLIGCEQTISQPYVVAIMTEALRLTGTEKVLEIGTGSGYQTAILAELAGSVWSVEIVAPLAARARATLAELGYTNVTVVEGDGHHGLPEQSPFDAILVAAATPEVPSRLVEQLRAGGRMVIPLSAPRPELFLFEKRKDGLRGVSLGGARFVPMTGHPAPGEKS